MLTAAVLLSSAFAGGGARVASPRAARGHVSCSIPLLPIDPEAAVAAATAAAAAVGADPLAAITAAMPAGLEAAGIDPLLAAGVGAATASAVLANSLNEPQTQGMPALYDGWFNGQIEAGARGAVAAAHRAGIRQMEVSFPPVPNLEEVAYGTVLNQKFLKGVAAELGLDAKKTALSVKRNPVEYANAAWARRIARACSGTAVIASQADLRAAKKPPGSVREITLTARPEASSRDTLIAVNPIGRWKAVDASHDGDVVMLNSAFSENYGARARARARSRGIQHGLPSGCCPSPLRAGWRPRL